MGKMPRPSWLIRDQAVDAPRPRPTPLEQGRILADVIGLAEAITAAKGGAVTRGPLLMPLLPALRRNAD